MTANRTMVFPSTENRSSLARRRVRRISTASLAAVLTLASLAACGMEVEIGKAEPSRFKTKTLPPIPCLQSEPWLDLKAGMKVDTLLSPVLNPSGIKLEPAGRDQMTSGVS